MADKAVLELKDISRRRGNKMAVDHCSASLYAGEIVGLVGSNGAGKTTLIKMIVHHLRADGGSVRIQDVDVQENFTEAIRHVGAVVEAPALYPYMSGIDHLTMTARMYPKVTRERIQEVIDLIGLKNRIQDKVKKYTPELRQRLAIAQAILSKPSLLILDEPANGPDPINGKELRGILRTLSEEGMCILLSSRSLSEMDRLCSRIIIMREGRFIADLSSQELLDPNRVRVRMRVGQPERAYEVLEALVDDANIQLEDDELVITGENLQVQQMNRLLIYQDIDVYEIGVYRESLEESFMERMRGDEDEQANTK